MVVERYDWMRLNALLIKLEEEEGHEDELELGCSSLKQSNV